MTAVVAAAFVLATAWAARQASVASWLGSRRPIRADARAGLAPGLLRPPAVVDDALREFVPDRHRSLAWTAWLGGTGLAMAVGWTAGRAPVALVAAGLCVGAPWAARGPLRRRRLRHAARDVPVALELMARSLRAGATVHGAVADAGAAMTGPVGVGLRQVGEATARGQPLVDALDHWRATAGHQIAGVRLAVDALAVAVEVGGGQAAALDGVATTLRQRLAAEAEAWALGAQARLSAMVIALAPLVFAALASAADRSNARFLLRAPAGLAMLVTGLALDGAGAWWMARLTRLPGPHGIRGP
jgi:tight adherence protein B